MRKTIKECDKKLANFRHALATAPSDSVARWIAETEAERRGAELRLRWLTKNEGMTADEIRDIVSQMQGLVSILHNATPEDRSRVYQAANLNISYDHANKKAKLHASPDPEAWSYKRVGGGT